MHAVAEAFDVRRLGGRGKKRPRRMLAFYYKPIDSECKLILCFRWLQRQLGGKGLGPVSNLAGRRHLPADEPKHDPLTLKR